MERSVRAVRLPARLSHASFAQVCVCGGDPEPRLKFHVDVCRQAREERLADGARSHRRRISGCPGKPRLHMA